VRRRSARRGRADAHRPLQSTHSLLCWRPPCHACRCCLWARAGRARRVCDRSSSRTTSRATPCDSGRRVRTPPHRGEATLRSRVRACAAMHARAPADGSAWLHARLVARQSASRTPTYDSSATSSSTCGTAAGTSRAAPSSVNDSCQCMCMRFDMDAPSLTPLPRCRSPVAPSRSVRTRSWRTTSSLSATRSSAASRCSYTCSTSRA
jgi:hypothetical protein